MNDKKKLKKMRDTFRDTADIIDEIFTLDEREDKGEDIQKESEVVLGRFMLKMVELQVLSS